jgi:hypothetical protein
MGVTTETGLSYLEKTPQLTVYTLTQAIRFVLIIKVPKVQIVLHLERDQMAEQTRHAGIRARPTDLCASKRSLPKKFPAVHDFTTTTTTSNIAHTTTSPK